jgi:predicted Zn-ribbon and HTH transcriptional regulator
MSGWNLPPGCTPSDVDRAAGAYDAECDHCGDVGLAYNLNEDGHCPRCAADLGEEP